MKTAPLAKALTRKSHAAGVPGWMIPILYIPPAAVFIATEWMWQAFIPSAVLHLYMAFKYRKDEYWLKNLVDALRSPQSLRPWRKEREVSCLPCFISGENFYG